MVKNILIAAAIMSGLAPMASAQLSIADKAFAIKTAKANNYELKAAQMAESKSNNEAFKAYAQAMMNDHTQAAQQLATAVSSADPSMQLPTGVSASDQAKLDTLEHSGSNFDRKYRQQMIASHAMLHNYFQDYLKNPKDNAGIKQVAQGMEQVAMNQWNQAKQLPRQ